MELYELYQKMDELVEEMKKFLEEHTDEDGTISTADAATYDKMEKKFLRLEEMVTRKEKLDKAQDFLRQPLNPSAEPILTYPQHNNPFARDYGTYQRAGVEGREYKANFLNEIRTGFKTAQNFLREASLPDGGYLLPIEMHDEIISALSEANILRQIGKVITTASEHKISVVATKPAASWIAEGQDISFTDEKFASISLNAYKMAIAIKVSTELLQDSYYNIEDHIISEFSAALAACEESAMLLGDGQGKPKGLLPTLTASATGTLQTNGSEITADDLLTLQFSLRRPYRKNSCWLTSDAGLAQIRRLKDTTGNFIWQPSIVESEPSRLFGQPIYTSEFMPAPTSGNVAVLYGDFKDYFLIGQRGEMEFQPLRELYAMSGQVAYLMTSRIDSVLTNAEAIRGLKIRA